MRQARNVCTLRRTSDALEPTDAKPSAGTILTTSTVTTKLGVCCFFFSFFLIIIII